MGEIALELMNKFSLIEVLELRENHIAERQIEVLCRGLCENTSLRTIQLENCRLKKNALEKLCTAIRERQTKSIDTLNLINFRVGMQQADTLSQLLRDYRQL